MGDLLVYVCLRVSQGVQQLVQGEAICTNHQGWVDTVVWHGVQLAQTLCRAEAEVLAAALCVTFYGARLGSTAAVTGQCNGVNVSGIQLAVRVRFLEVVAV